MLGALIGDIAGSRFEWHNHKSKDFELLTALHGCRPTDDSIMSLAVAKAIMNCDGDYSDLDGETVSCMQELGRKYPHAGYGGRFHKWIFASDPQPYNSYGNGAAMRVSPCGFANILGAGGDEGYPQSPGRDKGGGGGRCCCLSRTNRKKYARDPGLHRDQLL